MKQTMRTSLRFVEAVLNAIADVIKTIFKWAIFAVLAAIVIGTAFVYLIALIVR